MIGIVDYKTANVGSILNMFRHIGVKALVIEEPRQLDSATGILLPGIGHFDTCATNLRNLGFVDALSSRVQEHGVPLLGICVGAQLLAKGSEEGNLPGLGWIDAEVLRFQDDPDGIHKVPHMGWNAVRVLRQHGLFQGLDDDARFYFVHSYFLSCRNGDDVLGVTTHGRDFASAIGRQGVSGVQFHPEKSHRYGMQLLRNFASLSAKPAV